ncbi:NUDIX hydrolase [Parerythrobacter aestuarii]|uniref:NUDIX hydrolase n=1 Tax=Parerythrobacter aestuarii TaxID=3020909 RepID=UPI0024DEE09B|nr:NUDIX domain-containing protein [Parerythrobacter aestuarii]
MSETGTSRRIRRAARVIVLDPEDRVLLFRFVLDDRPPFWVTTGGECDPGESFEEAARRELREETGFEADPGPQIAQQTPEFITVEGEPVRADERFFRVRVSETRIDTSGHTALEQRVMQEHRWFTPEELASWHEYIYPRDLAELIERDPQP